MASKDIYLRRLRTMQETARKIKPSPKADLKKVVLTAEAGNTPKKEADCQF